MVRLDPAPRKPKPSRRPRRLTDREKDLVEEAVAYCSGVLTDGFIQQAADKATNYVDDETWSRLISHGRSKNCDALADLARNILDGKEKLHSFIGWLADQLFSLLNRSRIERIFARQLAKRIPIPLVDDHLPAVARGLQVTGIVICFLNDRELTRCACFVDLVIEEGKARVKQIITAAATDWTQLHHVPVPP